MMEFLQLNKQALKKVFDGVYKDDLVEFFDYVCDIFDLKELMKLPMYLKDKKQHIKTQKKHFVDFFVNLLSSDDIKIKVYKKLSLNVASKYLYEKLIWESSAILSVEAIDRFGLDLKPIKNRYYGREEEKLEGNLSLIYHQVEYDYNVVKRDILYIKNNMRNMLKCVFPLPQDYYLLPAKEIIETDFTYSNENGVLEFINVISGMIENDLVEFGKTGGKPLAKTLNILKTSTSINEFFSEKKMDTFAVDMLTRSFYYYSLAKEFQEKEFLTLKNFTMMQLDDNMKFFISRIFLSHLKKVKFDDYYTSQNELFDLVKLIINDMPKDDWVGFENIINYCKYREYSFEFEYNYKTYSYYMDCDITTYDGNVETDTLYARNYYYVIFFEPVLKAVFFYLGALGLLELKYSEPVSLYTFRAKDKPYISVWDGLEYIKLTELGKYVFRFSKTYSQKEIQVKKSKVKFDEYKPIITIESQDSIMMAKLEPFAEKLDTNRYILSYPKIFKECKNYKTLELKIESFYKQIEKNPPKVFVDFFNDIKKSANLLKRDLKQVVITVKNDKKLLDLFMTNKKLKELIIKAEGYRIIILKEDIPKLSKIIKDNGFFIEF